MNLPYKLTIKIQGLLNHTFSNVRHDCLMINEDGEYFYPETNDAQVINHKLYLKGIYIPVNKVGNFIQVLHNLRGTKDKYLKATFIITADGECMYDSSHHNKLIQIVFETLDGINRTDFKKL